MSTDIPEDAPYAPPASGGDPDSRRRALKHQLANAETSGDTDAADAIRQELAAAGQVEDRETAATNRKAAAVAAGPGAVSTPPQGRAAPAKAATVAKAKG